MSSVYQRVYQLSDILQVDKKDLARKLKVSIQLFNSMKGKNTGGPSSETLSSLFYSYPEVNERWVLLGEGVPLRSEEKNIFQEPEIKYSREFQELILLLKKDRDAFNLIDIVLRLRQTEASIKNMEWRFEKLEKIINSLTKNM